MKCGEKRPPMVRWDHTDFLGVVAYLRCKKGWPRQFLDHGGLFATERDFERPKRVQRRRRSRARGTTADRPAPANLRCRTTDQRRVFPARLRAIDRGANDRRQRDRDRHHRSRGNVRLPAADGRLDHGKRLLLSGPRERDTNSRPRLPRTGRKRCRISPASGPLSASICQHARAARRVQPVAQHQRTLLALS
jgi:hypothetical protein